MRRLTPLLIALLVACAAWQIIGRQAVPPHAALEHARPRGGAGEAADADARETTPAEAPAVKRPADVALPVGEADISEDAAVLEAMALEAGHHALPVAIDWLRGLPAGEARNRALAVLVARLGEKDPAAAVSLAAKFEPDDGRAGILMQGFERWIGATPLVASRWLGENENHPLADVLISQLASHPRVIAANPALALQWSALLEEPDARRQQIEAVLVEWGRRDLRGASDYLRRLEVFDSAEKRRLLDRLAKENKRRG